MTLNLLNDLSRFEHLEVTDIEEIPQEATNARQEAGYGGRAKTAVEELPLIERD